MRNLRKASKKGQCESRQIHLLVKTELALVVLFSVVLEMSAAELDGDDLLCSGPWRPNWENC